MIETYTKADADKLIAYYKPLLLGKIIEQSVGAKITDLGIEPYSEGKFRVNAIARKEERNYRREITKVAFEHKLAAPADVLKHPNQ